MNIAELKRHHRGSIEMLEALERWEERIIEAKRILALCYRDSLIVTEINRLTKVKEELIEKFADMQIKHTSLIVEL